MRELRAHLLPQPEGRQKGEAAEAVLVQVGSQEVGKALLFFLPKQTGHSFHFLGGKLLIRDIIIGTDLSFLSDVRPQI